MGSTLPSTAGRKFVDHVKSERGAETRSAADQPKVWWGLAESPISAVSPVIWSARQATRIDRSAYRAIEMVPFEQTSAGNVLSQCDIPRHRRHEGHQQHDGLVSQQTIPPARDEGTHWAGAQRPKALSSPVERPKGFWRMVPTRWASQKVYTRPGARERRLAGGAGSFFRGARREGKCSSRE